MASGTACLGCDPVEADRTGTPNGELYRRGAATLIASWVAYARGSPGAEVIYGPGVAAAVFPAGPERTVFNNALMERRLGPAGRNRALDAMQHAYAAAAVRGLRCGCTRVTERCAPTSQHGDSERTPRAAPWA